MCVAIIKPANAEKPSYETLESCYFKNQDGIGFATSNGEIHHTMSFTRFIELFNRVDDSEAMIIHFRWATHGSVGTKNCHPFYDKKHGIVFAHNGVIDIMTRGDMTDSETWFRDKFIPMVDELGYDNKTLWDWVRVEACGNRFAFMKDGGIIQVGNWHNYRGCQYSNMNWQFGSCWPVYVNKDCFVLR